MGPPELRGASSSVALVFSGGDPPDPAAVHAFDGVGLVIAADSGLEHAQRLGVAVDIVVGDLDSVGADALTRAEATGTTVERHPVDKDATDLELALLAARDRGADTVHVIGGHGGRLDHLLGNALLLASPAFATMTVDAVMGDALVTVVHDRTELVGAPGLLCSLLPVGGPATGVVTTGLRFPLVGETLEAGSTRGISNEFEGRFASVSLDTGVLLAVLPQLPKES